MNNNEIDEINTLLADIWAQLKVNEQALANSEPFQTDGLENKVKEVCANVMALPKEQALEFESELNKMIDFLTTLSTEMQARQDLLKGEAGTLNQHERAMKAYQKQAGKKPKKPSNNSNS